MKVIKTEVVKFALMSKEDIKEDQDNIRASIVGLDQSVHNNALQCMLHAQEHGDTSLMRRLVIDVLGTRTKATGYRTQGLIVWARKFSPMELKGDIINLSGVQTGEYIAKMRKQFPDLSEDTFELGAKRPFLIEQASITKFWADADSAEQIGRPIFQQTLMSKFDTLYKELMSAAENTANGQPVDIKKAYYKGVQMDNVVDLVEKMKALRDQVPKDETREVEIARQKAAELLDFADANDPEKLAKTA